MVRREDTLGEQRQHPLTHGEFQSRLQRHVRPGLRCRPLRHMCILRRSPPEFQKVHQREHDQR